MIACWITLFVTLQMFSYTEYIRFEPFHEGAEIEESPEIELTPDQIEVSEDGASDLKSIARDRNDTRERSSTDYYENKSAADIEQQVKEMERQMFEEAGGESERQAILEEIERLKELEKQKKSEAKNENQPKKGGDKAYSGGVMAEAVVDGRNPFQNDMRYIPIPGYKCGYGAQGTVVVQVKVNQNGNVTSASYDPAQSSNANACMIEEAVKYAEKARFNYSGSAPKIQAGYIIYKFVSQ